MKKTNKFPTSVRMEPNLFESLSASRKKRLYYCSEVATSHGHSASFIDSKIFWFSFAVFFTFAITVFQPAHALDVQLFEPNFDQQGNITVQNTQMLHQWEYKPTLSMNWVRNPIEFGIVANDDRIAKIVGWFMTTDFIFATGITDDFTLGIDIPMNFGSSVDELGTITSTKGFNIGDVTLSGKYLLRKRHDEDEKIVPTIAIVPFITLPTGKNDVFFGNSSVVGGFRGAFDWKLAPRHKLSGNLGARIRSTETVLNLKVGPELLWGVGYDYLLSQEHHWNLTTELFGSTTFSKFASQEISSPFELLIGLTKKWSYDRWSSTFGFGRGGNNGYGSPDVRFFAGISYTGNKTVPKEVLVAAAALASRTDSDGDGIMDDVDKCPNEPEDKDGIDDLDGCPEFDRDKDGISDEKDKCPDQPETINGFDDDDGCPDIVNSKVKIEANKLVIMEKVYFSTGKGVILDKSKSILDQVVAVLKTYPYIKKIRVEGYTDDVGNDQSNLKLSQLRADNVKIFLMRAGIDPIRLESVGHGELDPIDTNDTPEGRDRNRRVEFTIVENAQDSTAETPVEHTSGK